MFKLFSIVAVATLLILGAGSPAEARTPPGPDFTIVVVPDTQFTAKNYPEILEAQGAYIAQLNPDLVLHVGDIVNELSDPAQWANFETAFAPVTSPTVFAAGNHDMEDYIGDTNPYATISDPFAAFNTGAVIDGAYDDLNFYRLLGANYLVMSLQFGAPSGVLAWAKGVALANPYRSIILVTHDYLNQKSQIRGAPDNGYELSLPKSFNTALENPYKMWTAFVKAVPNVKFVFSGHVTSKTSGKPYAIGYLRSTNSAGKWVYSMLANYQMYGQGGDGYLRIIHCSPSRGKFKVESYSPYLDSHLEGYTDWFTIEGATFPGID